MLTRTCWPEGVTALLRASLKRSFTVLKINVAFKDLLCYPCEMEDESVVDYKVIREVEPKWQPTIITQCRRY